ncbi:hypothetical protein [Microtetraspora malaysiensis]|uniref:Uncharacterized protein n=1 Tax=Microtetraspora malaysiensis TaxID=161358 RepID=A0ABW6T7S3_9ACTN
MRRLLASSAVLLFAAALPVGTGAIAYAESQAEPTVELIPAFSDDLPLSGAQHGPAAAASEVAAAPWACTVYASDPSKFANTIGFEDFQSCTGTGWSPQRVKVTLQRYLGAGLWQNKKVVDSGNAYIDFLQRDGIYDCSGTGNEEYRVVTDGYAVNGAYHKSVQSLNYLRVTC